MKCYICQNIIPETRIFSINNKHFCSDKCFGIEFNISKQEKQISKMYIKNDSDIYK